MTIEYIRYHLEADQRAAFQQAYAAASEQLDHSPFCIAYELSECEEEPGQFILRIEWTSTNDHLNGFRKSENFPSFFAYVKPFFNNIREMRHYQKTSIDKRKTSIAPQAAE